MIYVFNKADRTEFEYPLMEGEDRVIISARDDDSIDLLEQVIRRHLFKDYVTTTLLIPFTDGQVVSYLNEHCNILNTSYEADGTKLEVEIANADLPRFEQYMVVD